MKGTGVREGARLEGASLIDVAPTLLHYLGEGVPSDFDGHVLQDVFTADEIGANPIRIVDAPAEDGDDRGEHGLTSEEMKEIRDRLKRIGYLG